MRRMIVIKLVLSTTCFLLLLLAGPMFMAACSSTKSVKNWHQTDRSSAGIAPSPDETPEAIVQVYGARAYSWRGQFAVHTWIATKAADAPYYNVHEVVGWGRDKIRSRTGKPDHAWYGNKPALLADIRGKRAAEMIPQIDQAIKDYPYPHRYQAWPGPNSNTFVAWVIRQVPDLRVALPNIAIGKDYLGEGVVASTPTGTGYQFSLWGWFGVLASVREGVELNVLGLSIGVDPMALAIKLPGVGQLGWRDPWMDAKPAQAAEASPLPLEPSEMAGLAETARPPQEH